MEVVQVVCAYWAVSISMVYLNKALLSSDDSLPAPLFITCVQCAVSCLVCVLLGHAGESSRLKSRVSFTTEWPRIQFSFRTSRDVLPLSLIFVGMITFNNLCLQHVEVSFYTVARCLSLVFNVALSYVLLGKPTSLPVCGTLVLVIAGFLVGVDGEIHLSLLGTAYGVLSSLFVSLSHVYTAKVLPAVGNDKSLLIFYNNFNACCCLAPLSLLLEGGTLIAGIDRLLSLRLWAALLLASGLGFAVALVTVLQIKFTSPLTHNISGTAKAAAQSLLAFYLWGNVATWLSLLGLILVLLGSAMYTVAVMRESAAAPAVPAGKGDDADDAPLLTADKEQGQ